MMGLAHHNIHEITPAQLPYFKQATMHMCYSTFWKDAFWQTQTQPHVDHLSFTTAGLNIIIENPVLLCRQARCIFSIDIAFNR